MILFNLAPHHHKTAYGKFPSDGLSLLRLPFSSKAEIDQNIVLYYELEGQELRKSHQLNKAMQWYHQALSVYPESAVILNGYALVHMDSERYEEAKAVFVRILEKQEPNAQDMAIILNNLAYVDILIGKKELIKEADTASLRAFESCPWISAVKGTRGMVLVELGRFDEAIPPLEEALEGDEELQNKALNAAYLAVAEVRKGNGIRAQQYLEIAEQYHSDCPLLKRAQHEFTMV